STELPDYVEFFSPLRRVRVCYRGSFRNSFSASTPQLTLIEHRAHQEYLALRDLLTLVSRLLAEVAGPIPRRISLARNRCIPGLSGHCQALLRSATGGAPPGLWGKHSNHIVETRTHRDMILRLERVDEHRNDHPLVISISPVMVVVFDFLSVFC